MTKKLLACFAVCLFSFTGCAFFNIPLVPPKTPLQERVVAGYGADKILLLDISGTITMEGKSQLGGLSKEPSLVARIKEELELAQADPDVKAIVLKINSPGGTVTASDIIHHELLSLKKRRNIKIVACLMEMGTSGAYYIATSADRIVALPTTITGSIGVMVLKLSFTDLMKNIGVQEETVKSGDKKDLLFPYRSMSSTEREVVQEVVDQLQARFLQVIREGRPAVNKAQLDIIGDGRILTPLQAQELGLVDKIGYLEEAIDTARRVAGLRDFQVIRYQSLYGPKANIYTQAKEMVPQQPTANSYLNNLLPTMNPSFMYLWMP